MPKFYMIDIYNINIIIKTKTETEKYYVDTFKKKIETENVSVETICKWCVFHHIQYGIKFKYYKFNENTISKNIKYWIEYMVMKKSLEKLKKCLYN